MSHQFFLPPLINHTNYEWSEMRQWMRSRQKMPNFCSTITIQPSTADHINPLKISKTVSTILSSSTSLVTEEGDIFQVHEVPSNGATHDGNYDDTVEISFGEISLPTRMGEEDDLTKYYKLLNIRSQAASESARSENVPLCEAKQKEKATGSSIASLQFIAASNDHSTQVISNSLKSGPVTASVKNDSEVSLDRVSHDDDGNTDKIEIQKWNKFDAAIEYFYSTLEIGAEVVFNNIIPAVAPSSQEQHREETEFPTLAALETCEEEEVIHQVNEQSIRDDNSVTEVVKSDLLTASCHDDISIRTEKCEEEELVHQVKAQSSGFGDRVLGAEKNEVVKSPQYSGDGGNCFMSVLGRDEGRECRSCASQEVYNSEIKDGGHLLSETGKEKTAEDDKNSICASKEVDADFEINQMRTKIGAIFSRGARLNAEIKTRRAELKLKKKLLKRMRVVESMSSVGNSSCDDDSSAPSLDVSKEKSSCLLRLC